MTTQQEIIDKSARGPEYAYRIAAAVVALILLLTWFSA